MKAERKAIKEANGSRVLSPSVLNSRYAVQKSSDSKTLPEISPIYAFQTEQERDKLLKKIYKKQLSKRFVEPGPQFYSPLKMKKPQLNKNSIVKP